MYVGEGRERRVECRANFKRLQKNVRDIRLPNYRPEYKLNVGLEI